MSNHEMRSAACCCHKEMLSPRTRRPRKIQESRKVVQCNDLGNFFLKIFLRGSLHMDVKAVSAWVVAGDGLAAAVLFVHFLHSSMAAENELSASIPV